MYVAVFWRSKKNIRDRPVNGNPIVLFHFVRCLEYQGWCRFPVGRWTIAMANSVHITNLVSSYGKVNWTPHHDIFETQGVDPLSMPLTIHTHHTSAHLHLVTALPVHHAFFFSLPLSVQDFLRDARTCSTWEWYQTISGLQPYVMILISTILGSRTSSADWLIFVSKPGTPKESIAKRHNLIIIKVYQTLKRFCCFLRLQRWTLARACTTSFVWRPKQFEWLYFKT